MNKAVVITGASAGIGKAMAFEFAARGYSLGLTSRRLAVLEDVRAQILAAHPTISVEVAAIDVNATDTVAQGLASLIEALGNVDIVVVNAGINKLTHVGKDELQEELAVVQTNLMGAIATVHAAAQHFRARGRGHIVGISSLASIKAIPTQAAYCATKAGFSIYLDAARIELARHNIKVTTILPGFVRTEIVPGIEKFPFIVSAEKAATEIATIIERGDAMGIVPAFPWRFVRPFLGMVPDSIWARIK